jgi:hypothetical protein
MAVAIAPAPLTGDDFFSRARTPSFYKATEVRDRVDTSSLYKNAAAGRGVWRSRSCRCILAHQYTAYAYAYTQSILDPSRRQCTTSLHNHKVRLNPTSLQMQTCNVAQVTDFHLAAMH